MVFIGGVLTAKAPTDSLVTATRGSALEGGLSFLAPGRGGGLPVVWKISGVGGGGGSAGL